MNFRLKIFLFLTALISITMFLVYIYAIGVVEDDRRNFINEYMENISENENLRISSTVRGVRQLSNILCLINSDSEDYIKQIKDFISQIVYEYNISYLNFRKGRVLITYNKMGEDILDDKIVLKNRYILMRFEKDQCSLISAIDTEKIFRIDSNIDDGRIFAIAIQDSLIVKEQFREKASSILEEVKSYFSKSRSGVFQNEDYVIGYSKDESENITTLFMIRREIFEKAIVSLRYRIFLAGLVVLSLFLLIGFFIAGRITRPMKLLQEKAQRIVHGSFEKIDFNVSSDEIGDAVKAFNRMIDDLKIREENLKESQMRLIQAEKLSAFGQLSAGIAHEVKNPLTSVMGYIQLARRLEKDDKINEYMRIAENETMRCKQILDDLLKFARMDRHQKSDINICEVVSGTIKLISHQLMMKKIKLNYSVEKEPIIVYGNANQLQQVLLNILLNAMQSIERKKIEDGEISVEEIREGGNVLISVKDNGEGISKENLGKIFEPFFTTKVDTGGTGLGLSISYGIIKEHNGDIRVFSEVGKGTEFIIVIPAKE